MLYILITDTTAFNKRSSDHGKFKTFKAFDLLDKIIMSLRLELYLIWTETVGATISNLSLINHYNNLRWLHRISSLWDVGYHCKTCNNVNLTNWKLLRLKLIVVRPVFWEDYSPTQRTLAVVTDIGCSHCQVVGMVIVH